ncbi:MAG: ATP-binding cassette domain-containing protein, partial [Gammaproteobacteria bacterium]
MPAEQGMTLIATQGVSVQIGAKQILSNVDLSIGQGEIVTLVGPNGSGKTTLLKVLIGAQTPTRGAVMREAGLRIGYVPQRLAIERAMPMTVSRWLALSGFASVAERKSIAERVGIVPLLDQQMTSLSGGEFQRALLAHALLIRPDLLVLDEPTQGLDQPAVAA